MSALVRVLPKLPALQKVTTRVQPLLLQLLCTGFTFLACFAPLFDTMRPLGISIAAAVPGQYALAATVGAALGYAISLPMDAAAAYLTTIITVCLIRTVIVSLRKANNTLPVFAAVCGTTYLAVGIVMATVAGNDTSEILLIFAEGLIIFGTGALLKTGLLTPWKNVSQMPSQTKISLLFLLVVAIISVAPYNIYGANLAHILGISATLFAVISGREYSGAIMGITVNIALVAFSTSNIYAGFGIAAAGLIGGFYLKESRTLTALIFCLTGFLGVPLAPNSSAGILFMIELLIGSVVVIILPEKIFATVNLSGPISLGRATLTTLSGRLELLSGALSSVGLTLNSVCEKMPPNKYTYATICDTVTDAVCKNCVRCDECWADGSGDVYDAFNNMQSTLKNRGYVTPSDLPQPLAGNCKLPKRLTSAISTVYRANTQRQAANLRVSAMRGILTEQYNVMANAVAGLAGQVYREEMPDKRKEKRVARFFSSLGIEPLETTVSTDTYGSVYVEVHLPRTQFPQDELDMLTKEISAICRCKLSVAKCENVYTTTHILLAQKVVFSPVFGICSLAANEQDVSADVCKTFTDQKGCAHAILCDGMGTGKQAAVDGNLAATLSEKLMSSGFASSEAARLVNIALSLKNESDCAATLDALTINLYTGKARLFKAGAAASFLVRQNVVTVLEGDSLPIGILGTVTGRSSNIQLELGDMIVMASDGALIAGQHRISAILAAAENVSPKAMAKRIVQDARSRTKRPDDTTVICIRIEKAKK